MCVFGLVKHAGSQGNKTPCPNTKQENKCTRLMFNIDTLHISVYEFIVIQYHL